LSAKTAKHVIIVCDLFKMFHLHGNTVFALPCRTVSECSVIVWGTARYAGRWFVC